MRFVKVEQIDYFPAATPEYNIARAGVDRVWSICPKRPDDHVRQTITVDIASACDSTSRIIQRRSPYNGKTLIRLQTT